MFVSFSCSLLVFLFWFFSFAPPTSLVWPVFPISQWLFEHIPFIPRQIYLFSSHLSIAFISLFQCHPSCFSVWSFRFHMLPIPPLVCLVNWLLARVWPQPRVIWNLNFHSVYAWALFTETSAVTFQLIFHFFNVVKRYEVLSVGWKSASTNLEKLKEQSSVLWWGTRPHALLLPQSWCGVCHVRLEVWGHHITMHWLTHK